MDLEEAASRCIARDNRFKVLRRVPRSVSGWRTFAQAMKRWDGQALLLLLAATHAVQERGDWPHADDDVTPLVETLTNDLVTAPNAPTSGAVALAAA